MDCLPIELQTRILDEIPQFTRLSKTRVAGKNYLDHLSKKNIIKTEFIRYILIYKPRYFYIFKKYSYKYYIYRVTLSLHLIPTYYINTYIVAQNSTEILFDTEEYVDNSFVDGVIGLINKLKGNVFYDITTTIDIYQKFRTECINCKAILLEKINRFTCNYRNIIEPYPDLVGDISTILTNIKIYLYIACNDNSIDDHQSSLLLHIINMLKFDYNGNYNGARITLLDFASILYTCYPTKLTNVLALVQ